MYRVDNAIILAAGRGTRLLHLTSETPKPLLSPRGKVIIEDIIEKLREKNISKIYIVVGYLKEKFEYLKSKYNVILVDNPNWASSNNVTSLLAAKHFLKNTLIINGDIIIKSNIFANYYEHAVSYAERNANVNEWIIEINSDKNIYKFIKNGKNLNGFYQKEILFITNNISEIIKKNNLKIDLNEYYEYLILNICNERKFDFKVYEIEKDLVFDLDTIEAFEDYANRQC